MSANLRILRQIKESADNLVAQVPELRAPLTAFNKRTETLSKLKDVSTKQSPFRYPLVELEEDLMKRCITAITVYYERKYGIKSGKDMPKVVYLFLKAVNDTIISRIEGVNSCKNPESVKDWRLGALAGLESEKQSIEDSWRNPKTYPSLYKGRVRGILFYGPPGTGKTVLAKAMSNSLPGVAFYSVDAASLKSKWHGETEKQIASKFDCASDAVESGKYSSAIVFLDEIDSIGSRRTEDGGGASGSTTPALLVAMDGFFSSPDVAVVGATNVPWQLDGGLLRRFDERVFVDLPTIRARIGIVLDALVKQFMPPWIGGPAEHGWINDNVPSDLNAMLDTDKFTNASLETWGAIEQYVTDAKSKPTYRGSDGKAIAETPITASNIKTSIVEIAKLLGPKQESRKDMTSRASRPEEFYDKATSLYGFNASDITTVVKKAASIAARKLFSNQYAVTWVYVTASDNQKYAVARFYDEDDLMESITPISITDAYAEVGPHRLLNFTFTVEDFKRAITEVGSSVNSEDYVRVLKWKNTGQ